MRLIFDIEGDNLLDNLSKIHCVVAYDVDRFEQYTYRPDKILNGLKLLEEADELIGHNIMDYDIPALQKIYPGFDPKGKLSDTLVMSRLVYADLRDRDFENCKKNSEFPRNLIGSHGLKAWGYRLNEHKGGVESFDEFTEEMLEYCIQDVRVNRILWERLLAQEFSPQSIALEHDVQRILLEQEKHGFAFNRTDAVHLYGKLLDRRRELDEQLALVFPPWDVKTPFTPKVNRPALGYVKGVPTHKIRTVDFNPGSRDHVALKLTEKYGWKPDIFTPQGKPQIDEAVLSKLTFPEAKLLEERFLLTKRIGQIAEGKNSWLNLEKRGSIHGRVQVNGAVTGRMTHSSPNMAQVPSTRALYGQECRALFHARPGRVLVGCDADALELRCLAGYMAYYDDGKYISTVLDGDKAVGTDMHSLNASVLGCDRDTAKTWFYAFIYGAGDRKLGSILGSSPKRGKDSRASFLRSLPALRALTDAIKTRVEDRGYLLGLDGRKLFVRSSHSALNTLLQGAGAILMKQALVLCDDYMQGKGDFVANVHDEWQIETTKEYQDEVGSCAVRAIRDAGSYFGFKCPLDAQYVTGATWADTH